LVPGSFNFNFVHNLKEMKDLRKIASPPVVRRALSYFLLAASAAQAYFLWTASRRPMAASFLIREEVRAGVRTVKYCSTVPHGTPVP
jgi:hypothetical protein